jgi:hypothetical protein
MDPTVGRFVGMDPWRGQVWDPTSLHRYLYANNRPSDFIDPSGLSWSAGTALTVVAVVGLIAGSLYGAISTGTVRGTVESGAFGFVLAVTIFELSAFFLGLSIAVLVPGVGAVSIAIPRSRAATVTLPGARNVVSPTVTLQPPLPASFRLTEASTRTQATVSAIQRQVQQPGRPELLAEARAALAKHQRLIEGMKSARGGSPQNGPGGAAPASLEEAAANFRSFWEGIDSQMTERELVLIDDLLDGRYR